MSNYLMKKYKGKYRLKAPIDKSTNDFPKKLDDTNEDIDIFIKCKRGKIFHYGHGVLQAYIDKLGTGRNILKSIGKELNVNIDDYTITKEKKDGTLYTDKQGNLTKFYDYENFYKALEEDKTIFDIEETDEEVLFKFKDKDIELIAKYMLPQTSGVSISPFSNRNLPKAKYEIPLEDLQEYKDIISFVPKEDILYVSHATKDFISNISKNYKEFKGKDIKAEQKKVCLKGKEFIHSVNLWEDYLKFLKSEIDKR